MRAGIDGTHPGALPFVRTIAFKSLHTYNTHYIQYNTRKAHDLQWKAVVEEIYREHPSQVVQNISSVDNK